MLRAYFRLILFIIGLVGAVILFAFAFTAAAVVVLIAFVVLALIGRPPRVDWWTVKTPSQRRPGDPHGPSHRDPLTIDHDPADLPGDRRD